jgi:predicted nuclease of predicted toxin-antitoxin system
MRVLLDECVDWRLARDLADHDTRTVKQLGWERVDDRELLGEAAQHFDVFVTVDKDLPNELDLRRFDLAVVVLRGRTTRLPDLRQLLSPLRRAIRDAKPRRVQILDWRELLP